MWDERYAGDDYLFGTTPNAFLVRSVDHLPSGGAVLAVADGEGRNGVWLAERGFRVHAIDASSVALDKAARLGVARSVNVQFEQADLLAWDWPKDAYDAVVAIFVQFAGPEDRRNLFANMVGALRPGGVLLLEGYRLEQLAYGTGGPPLMGNLYTPEQLREELADLTIESIKAYDAEIEEGSGHSGMSALIDVIARKP